MVDLRAAVAVQAYRMQPGLALRSWSGQLAHGHRCSQRISEVFVCATSIGNIAWNCPIEANNVYNNQQSIQAYIPADYKTYRIIVTSGNAGFGGNYCGPYTLDVQRLPQ